MKKAIKKYFGLLTLLALFSPLKSAEALLPFIGPSTVTLDGATDAANTIDNIGTQLNAVATSKIEIIQEKLKVLQAKYNEYKNDFTGVMNSAQKPPLEGTRTIVDSTIAKMDDPESVKRAVYDLFLTYPTSDFAGQQECDKNITQFYIDTMIEINTAAIKLQEEYEADLKERVKNMPTDILSGENGAEVADDNNSAWKNKYNVYKTYDDLVQMLQELTAMKVQFMVAKAIMNEIPDKKPSEEKQSLLNKQKTIKMAGVIEKRERMAFGQVSEDSGESTGYNYHYNPSEDSGVSYTTTGKTDQESPFADSRDAIKDLETISPAYNNVLKALEIHNLLQSLPSRRQNMKKYNDFVALHDKSVERVKEADKCVIQFLGRYYEDPEKSWNGVFIGEQVTDYDLREGLSGWALATYEAAKEELSKEEEASTEDLYEMELDPTIDSTNLAENEGLEDKLVGQDTETGYKEKSKEEQAAENARKADMLAWNVGAEAAEMISQDQQSGKAQWGTIKASFPIWQDQKSFYGQYLTGKYQNIKDYLKQIDLRAKTSDLALILNTNQDGLGVVKSIVEDALKEAAQNIDKNDEYPKESSYSKLAQEKKEAIEKLQENKNKKMEELTAKREGIIEKLDASMLAVDELNEQINKATIEGRNEELSDEEYDVTALKTEKEKKQAEVEKYQAQLDAVDKEIEQVKQAYIKKEQEIENEYARQMAALEKTPDKVLTLGVPVIKIADLELRKAAQLRVGNIVSQANNAFSATRDYAQKLVDEALEDMLKTGDVIYTPAGGKDILSRHKKLISDLKSLNVSSIIASEPSLASITGLAKGEELLRTAYQAALTYQICSKVKCDEADEDYFVGAERKEEDFAGPKAAPEMSTAPMREIVHFDYEDYQNIAQLVDGSVSKESIINYGQKVPQVWKYMLKNPAYVEKDIDLAKALNQGGEARNFMRGGILPCVSNKKFIDAEEKKAAYYISPFENQKHTECLGLEVIKGSIGTAQANIYTLKDLELSENNQAVVEEKALASLGTPSELGSLFTYKDNKLYYNEAAKAAFSRLQEVFENEEDEEVQENMADALYIKTQFMKNQIGDFLSFAEREKEIRQHLEEIEEKITEAKTDLVEALTSAGYTPSADFDLSKEEDYNEAQSQLDDLKAQYVAEVEALLAQVTTSDFEIVNNQVESLRNSLEALKKDEDELLVLSEGTVADSAFDEKLKQEKANQDVANAYQEEADKSMADQINNYPVPYCAVY